MKTQLKLAAIIVGGIALMTGVGVWLRAAPAPSYTEAASLNVAVSQPIETLDSTTYFSRSASDTIGTLIHGLYARNAQGKLVPAVAAGQPTYSDDQLTVQITLRDCTWSDGTPVTATDFVYAWRKLADPKTKARNASRVDFLVNGTAVRTGAMPTTALGVEALDRNHLRLHLVQASPYLESLLTDTSLLPIPATFAAKLGSQYGDSAAHTLSNAGFTIRDWTGATDTAWRLVRNTRYVHASRVHLKAVSVAVIPDADTAAKQFTAGKLDYTPLAPASIAEYRDQNGFNATSTTTAALLFFNTYSGPTADAHLRRALAQAYDKNLLTRSKLQNGATPLNGLITQNATTDSDYRERTGQLMAYDRSAALREWRQAKRDLNVDRLTLTLTIADNDTAATTAAFLKSQLEHNLPGLTLKLKVVTFDERQALESAGRFQMVFATWTPADTDPVNFLSFYQTGNRMNITGFSDTKVDTLIDAIKAAGTRPASRLRLVQRTERYLMTKATPSAGVFQDGMAYLLNKRVVKFPLLPTGSINYEYVEAH